MYNLPLQTDAYHMTMGYLIENPLEIETHVLYARRGGPQVIANLSKLLKNICFSIPTRESVLEASIQWREKGIPFAERAWLKLTQLAQLPLNVRGVRDGQVVYPGDPIAVFTGPAILVAALEPLVLSEMMTSMQIATRFTKVLSAVDGDATRIAEVGMRAAANPTDHLNKLSILKRLGLCYTSNGEAAARLDLKAIGTMGHRFTQRFSGDQADQNAFDMAITRMLAFKRDHGIDGEIQVSLLLDTRNTLDKGLPAAVGLMKERAQAIKGKLKPGVRLDSGDMKAQLETAIDAFQQDDFVATGLEPTILIESGLTADSIAEFEAVIREKNFDPKRVRYGIGNYLVGSIDRDWTSLVYKVTEFGGQVLSDTRARKPTMKFSDADHASKESYPGHFDLWEREEEGSISHWISNVNERDRLTALGYQSLFRDLVIEGSLQTQALQSDESVQTYVQSQWKRLTQNYVKEEQQFYSPYEPNQRRPHFTQEVINLIDQLRSEQFG